MLKKTNNKLCSNFYSFFSPYYKYKIVNAVQIVYENSAVCMRNVGFMCPYLFVHTFFRFFTYLKP